MLAALRPGSTVFLGNSHSVSQPSVAKARQVIEFCDADVIDAVIADRVPLNARCTPI